MKSDLDAGFSRDRIVSMFGLFVGVSSLVFMIYRLAPDWEEATEALRGLRVSTVGALVLSIAAAELLFALTWTTNTRTLGARLSYLSGVVAYFYSGLSRFLPGAIVPYVARTVLVRGKGTTGVQASIATGLETTLSSIAALSLAFIGLSGRLVEFHRLSQFSVLIAVGVIAAGGVIAYRLLPRFLRVIGRGDESAEVPWSAVAGSLFTYAGGWLTMGWGVATLLGDLGGQPVDPLDAGGALALAWFAGFVALPIPGGLGVREAVIAGVLAGVVGLEIGILVAFIHRVAWSVVISIGGVIALGIRHTWHDGTRPAREGAAR